MIDESNMDPSTTELDIEALRILPSAKDEALVGFKMADPNGSDELSVFFRVNGFEKATRLFALDVALHDVWFGDDELWAVDRFKVHRFTGSFKKANSQL